jgi:hypothetical protein
MRQFGIVTGGRRWHGTEFIQIQQEALDVLQTFYNLGGSCVVSGCVVTAGVGSTYNISDGIVAIAHADGVKLARFTNLVNQTFPLYVTVSKTTVNKVYDDLNNKLAYNEYGVATTGVLPVSTPYLAFTADGVMSFGEAYGKFLRGSWIVATQVVTTDYTADLKFRRDPISNSLRMRFKITVNDGTYYDVTGSPGSKLFSTIFTIDPPFRPINDMYRKATLTPSFSGYRTGFFGVPGNAVALDNLEIPIVEMGLLIDTNGNVAIQFIPLSSSPSYDAIFDGEIPLD